MTSTSGVLAAPPARPAPAIISPAIDLLAVGGLSILVLVPLLLTGRDDLLLVGAGVQAWIGATVNMPHFLASYRMVYRDRATILKHRWAAIGVPLLLLLWISLALWESRWSLQLVTLLVATSSIYLAWHYTGQVWGMMASFAYLEGAHFDPAERRLVRGSLRFLLFWHVIWFVHTQVRAISIADFYWLVTIGSAGALAAGAVGLARMRRRIGRFPPLRAIVAWLAIFVWYAAMARDPKALFWVQIFHALQYLQFPFRVEYNRTMRARARGAAAHMVIFGALLLGLSVVMAQVLPRASMDVIGAWLGEGPASVTPVLILSFINIHHYFTDGVIWKLRNPEVRQDLFAHLAPEAAPSSAPTAGPPPRTAPGKNKARRR